jgi:transposase
LPPDVREWLPVDHLAWVVIDAVAEIELSAFYAAYRADGHGRAAHEPSVMVALVLYAFATKVRSSRSIERHCRQDVAYRVITGDLVPDHATIARFVCRHAQALAELFAEVLKPCDRAGLVRPGVVSIDGTGIAGNASPEVNHEFEQLARESVAETRATDEAEDEEFGDARGDEPPERLRSAEGRREFFRQARRELRREHENCEPAGEPEAQAAEGVPLELEANEIVGRGRQGRDAWSGEGKRQLERHRWEHPDPIPRARDERLLSAAERLADELDVERRANDAYEHYRATARDRLGRRPGGAAPAAGCSGREGEHNRPGLAPDRARVRLRAGLRRAGGGRRAAARARGRDHQQLDRLLAARPDGHRHACRARTGRGRRAARGGRRRCRRLERAADGRGASQQAQPGAGRARQRHPRHPQTLVYQRPRLMAAHPPRQRARPAALAKRKQTVEPLFGDTKHNSGFYRFHRRGRVKVRLEWRLLIMTHNLTKLHRHRLATVGA